MFKKSNINQEPELFGGVTQHLSNRKLSDLVDQQAWYNVFYEQVTKSIDENIFRHLYSNKQGRPNASIRLLASMIILKEAHDWTDQQLFENCRFNILVMRSLGLNNLGDEVPVESTYYDFKSKIDSYYAQTGVNLFEKLFSQITLEAVEKYNLSGTTVRMDSKLIQSNIVSCSRLQKIIQAVQVFCRNIPKELQKKVRKKTDRQTIELLMSKSASNHLFEMTKQEKLTMLRTLGFLIRKLLNIYSKNNIKHFSTLEKIYHQYYNESRDNNDDPAPRDKKDIQADSIQSIHDTEAAFKTKGFGSWTQKVSGYISNITELMCEQINIITDVQLERANYTDDQFLQSAITSTEDLIKQKIKDVHTDGGYDSIHNRYYFDEHSEHKVWHLSKLKGGIRYEFEQHEQGQIKVYDKQLKKHGILVKVKCGKYRLKIENGEEWHYRYFHKSQVETQLSLLKVRPKIIEKGIRANMESTIHQVFHPIKGNKSKYRGFSRHKIFVCARCIWVNCRRIQRICEKITLNITNMLSFCTSYDNVKLFRFSIFLKSV